MHDAKHTLSLFSVPLTTSGGNSTGWLSRIISSGFLGLSENTTNFTVRSTVRHATITMSTYGGRRLRRLSVWIRLWNGACSRGCLHCSDMCRHWNRTRFNIRSGECQRNRLKLFVALGATETVLVPDALLGFDLFHLKDGLLAGSAIGSVNLGALNKKKSVRDARNYGHAWLTLNFSWAFDESDERTWRTFFFCRASNLLKLDFCKSRIHNSEPIRSETSYC